MNANMVICRNEVVIEGENVGQFESFKLQSNSRTFGDSATLVLPLYALGVVQSGEARNRVRSVFKANVIKPTALVEVFMWYDGMEKIRVFRGFIEHVGEGFPTVLYLRDFTFMLRFGSMQKGWNGNVTLQQMVNDCIPVATEAFKKEREVMGLSSDAPTLYYEPNDKVVQATTTPIPAVKFAVGRSPYEIMQYLMQYFMMWAGVTDDGGVFIGAGVDDKDRIPVTELDTRYNVVGRDIVPIDGRFVDYNVVVSGLLENGKRYTYTAGLKNSRTTDQRTQFDKKYGEPVRAWCNLQSKEGIESFAERVLQHQKGFRNKGRLTLLLYPKVNILDSIVYHDSLFPELSGTYYVLGYNLTANDSGYFQTLEVTDQIYML